MTNELREAYIEAQTAMYRDVYVPAIQNVAARAVAAGVSDEKLRETLGAAYDKMMGEGKEPVIVENKPGEPPRFRTSAMARIPESQRKYYGGKSEISVAGPDVDHQGRIIEEVEVSRSRGGSRTAQN